MPTEEIKKLTAAWPKAYEAAVATLTGVGVNSKSDAKWAIRQKAGAAAQDAFSKAGVKVKVSAHIDWSGEKPTLQLRAFTMDGVRHEGGEQIDPRLAPVSGAAAPSEAPRAGRAAAPADTARTDPPKDR